MDGSNRRTAAAAAIAAAIGIAAAAPAGATARTVIAAGHVDAVAARLERGRLVSTFKDGTRRRVVWRDPGRVVVRVRPQAAFTVPSGMRFVGRRGQRAWLIPQVQRDGVVWAGWNTEEVPAAALRGGVRWTLLRVRGPGDVAVFQTGSFGSADVLFTTRRRLPQSTVIPPGTHAHGNWAFTRRGTYRLTYRLAARTSRGRRVRDRSTLTFKVG